MARKKVIIRCGCDECSRGLHRYYGKHKMQNTIQKERHTAKHLLKMGEYEKVLDILVSAGYLG